MGIRQQTIDDYGAFVEKFKPKKTTDDCYTPPEIYEAIKDWACREYGIDPSKVVRPFYPGGDYESFDYSDGKVVVDNPPFSILSKICACYRDRDIPFFLFAPNLTIFSSTSRNGAHMLVTDCAIEYANGAIVNTSFVTSFGDDLIRTAPDLTKLVNDTVKRVRRESRKHLPKYAYPPELLTVTRLNKVGKCRRGFSRQGFGRGVHAGARLAEGHEEGHLRRRLSPERAQGRGTEGRGTEGRGGCDRMDSQRQRKTEHRKTRLNIAPLSALLGEGLFCVFSVYSQVAGIRFRHPPDI